MSNQEAREAINEGMGLLTQARHQFTQAREALEDQPAPEPTPEPTPTPTPTPAPSPTPPVPPTPGEISSPFLEVTLDRDQDRAILEREVALSQAGPFVWFCRVASKAVTLNVPDLWLTEKPGESKRAGGVEVSLGELVEIAGHRLENGSILGVVTRHSDIPAPGSSVALLSSSIGGNAEATMQAEIAEGQQLLAITLGHGEYVRPAIEFEVPETVIGKIEGDIWNPQGVVTLTTEPGVHSFGVKPLIPRTNEKDQAPDDQRVAALLLEGAGRALMRSESNQHASTAGLEADIGDLVLHVITANWQGYDHDPLVITDRELEGYAKQPGSEGGERQIHVWATEVTGEGIPAGLPQVSGSSHWSHTVLVVKP